MDSSFLMLFGSDRSYYFTFLPHHSPKKVNIPLSEPLSSFCIVPGEYPNTTDGVLYLIRVIGGLYHISSLFCLIIGQTKVKIPLSEPLSSFWIVPGEYPNTTNSILHLISDIYGLEYPSVHFLPQNWGKSEFPSIWVSRLALYCA